MTENVQRVSLRYTPRKFQAMLHAMMVGIRFMVIVCHRRFGKTVFAIAHLLSKTFENPLHNPNYAYIAPTYGQAERVAWQYFKDFLQDIPGVKFNEAKLRITIERPHMGDHITVYLLGAESYDSIKGIYLDGCIMDEYAQCDPRIWGEVVRPMLTDRKGWAIFIGTPKGMNAFYTIYQQALRMRAENPGMKWGAYVAKASITQVIDPEELAAAKAEMSEEEYEQEFECSFQAALVGAYYGKYITELERKGQVKDFLPNPTIPVDTYWDLGIGDSTAIWFVQKVGSEYHIIDYLENSGVGLEWYAKQLKERDYVYGEHWLPHDGAAKELGTGTSRQETLRSLGIRTRIAIRQAVDDGINAVRIILPRCFFNRGKCGRGLDALKNYERKWDGKNNMFVDTPLHNWASHGSDAFRVFATTQRQSTIKQVDLPREADGNYNHWR